MHFSESISLLSNTGLQHTQKSHVDHCEAMHNYIIYICCIYIIYIMLRLCNHYYSIHGSLMSSHVDYYCHNFFR